MSTPRDVAVLVGSLRKDSFNRKLALALAAMAPAGLKLEIVEIGRQRIHSRLPGQIPGHLCRLDRAQRATLTQARVAT